MDDDRKRDRDRFLKCNRVKCYEPKMKHITPNGVVSASDYQRSKIRLNRFCIPILSNSGSEFATDGFQSW